MWRRSEKRWAAERLRARTAAPPPGGGDSAEGRPPIEPWIPPEWWGDWLWLARKHSRPRISQKAIAEKVSFVVRCSRRDVGRLERLKMAPEALIDVQRCMAFVSVLGLDPVGRDPQESRCR